MLLNRGFEKTGSPHGASCSCPACLGLQCLARPRYFSGQLLTEADLNSEQEYMLAKQRLHNRYLHGSGIVCGLQVTCSKSKGNVTIQSGYAIDPCGNDIIVCNAQDFNVIQRIQECAKERKKQPCDPITPPQHENCQDLERHYCLTIAYHERETRLSPTLRQGAASNTNQSRGSTCGCQSNSKKNGCGCNNFTSTTSSQTTNGTYQAMNAASTSSSSVPVSCQPTRILEEYQFDIIEVPPDYCADAREVLEDTLLAKVIECVTSLRGFLDKKLPHSTYETLLPLAFTGKIEESTSLDELYRSCCYLRQAVHELYKCDPLNTHCQTLDVLREVCCEPPPRYDSNNEEVAREARTTYIEQSRATLYNLLALLIQYVLDCICQALLPPCPCTENDDWLILACLTVKKDKIIDICNFCHRHYAGSFPALYYWLSLVPVIPLLVYAVERICCYDWLSLEFAQGQGEQREAAFRGHLVNGLTSLLNSIDPSGSLREAIFANGFAMPRSYTNKFQQLISKLSSPAKIAELLHVGGFNLTTIVDKPLAEATAALQTAGVTPVVHEVAAADAMPLLRQLTTSPFVQAGDHVVLYYVSDKVVGYTTGTPSPDIEPVKNDIASLKENLAQVPQAADVSQIKSDVEALKETVAGAAPSSSLDEVKNDVETLKSNLANVAQSSDLDAVKNDVETLKGSVANAAQASALDPIKNDVEALKGNLANAAPSSALETVRNDVETLKANVANAAPSADLETIRNDVDALKTNVASAAPSADLEAVRNDVETLKANVASAAPSADLEAVRNDVEALKGNITNAAQASDVSQLRSDVEALKGDVTNTAQSSALNEVKNDLEALKGSLMAVAQSSALDEVKNDLEALKGDMANAARTADVTGIRDEVNGIKSEVDALHDLQATIKALQDEIAALRSEVDQLKSRDTGSPEQTGDTPPAEPQ